MAKGRSRQSRSSVPGRDPFGIASDLPALPRMSNLSLLSLVEDRRQWHPERANRPALLFTGRPARVVAGRATTRQEKFKWPPHQVAFANPTKVLVCVRRKTRREVLLALGRGGGGARAPRRSWRSKISCKG